MMRSRRDRRLRIGEAIAALAFLVALAILGGIRPAKPCDAGCIIGRIAAGDRLDRPEIGAQRRYRRGYRRSRASRGGRYHRRRASRSENTGARDPVASDVPKPRHYAVLRTRPADPAVDAALLADFMTGPIAPKPRAIEWRPFRYPGPIDWNVIRDWVHPAHLSRSLETALDPSWDAIHLAADLGSIDFPGWPLSMTAARGEIASAGPARALAGFSIFWVVIPAGLALSVAWMFWPGLGLSGSPIPKD